MQSSSLALKFNNNTFSFTDKLYLEVQRFLSRLSFIIFGPIIFFLVFKVHGHKLGNLKATRKKYRKLLSEADGPVLVCSNHLTFVDSIIQAVFFNSIGGYLRNFQLLPWNLPEKKNFNHKLSHRIVCYLGKCIPVTRGASNSDGKKSLQKMLYILNKGDVISIFPEGKRSRSSMVDTEDFSYGVGKILNECENAKVLCLYMRGKQGGGFSTFPEKGQNFHFEMEMLAPKSQLKGLRKVRDLSTQVITKIAAMEKEYFANEGLDRK